MTNLKQYKNLIDWALNAHIEGELSLPERKRALLDEINAKFNTNYQQKHLDNWLRAGESKQAPVKVVDYFRDQLIEVEIQFDNDDLGRELRRLMFPNA